MISRGGMKPINFGLLLDELRPSAKGWSVFHVRQYHPWTMNKYPLHPCVDPWTVLYCIIFPLAFVFMMDLICPCRDDGITPVGF